MAAEQVQLSRREQNRSRRGKGPTDCRFEREWAGTGPTDAVAMTDALIADFKSLMGKHLCSCSTICDCKSLLRDYFTDPSAPYPGGKPQLLFRVRNPKKKTQFVLVDRNSAR